MWYQKRDFRQNWRVIRKRQLNGAQYYKIDFETSSHSSGNLSIPEPKPLRKSKQTEPDKNPYQKYAKTQTMNEPEPDRTNQTEPTRQNLPDKT